MRRWLVLAGIAANTLALAGREGSLLRPPPEGARLLAKLTIGSQEINLATMTAPDALGAAISRCGLVLDKDVERIELAASDAGSMAIEITGAMSADKLACALGSSLRDGRLDGVGPKVEQLPDHRLRVTTAAIAGDAEIGKRVARLFSGAAGARQALAAAFTSGAVPLELAVTLDGASGAIILKLPDSQSARAAASAVEAVNEPQTRVSRHGDEVHIYTRTPVALGRVLDGAVFASVKVSGASMRPTLGVGEVALFSRSWLAGPVHRGEVILFHDADSGQSLVKRVIGLPGDRVQIDGWNVKVNGRAIAARRLDSEAVVQDAEGPTEAELWEEKLEAATWTTFRAARPAGAPVDVTVPAGELYVLGDNRDNSRDSRHFGPIPESSVQGRAELVWWSPASGAARWERMGRAIR